MAPGEGFVAGPYPFVNALIVEDDVQLRRSVERLLAAWGIPSMTAQTVAEARTMLAGRPDLVITDVRLPDGTGLMVAEAANALSPAPLVVAMSGVASPSEAFELARHGVHLYLAKPFSPEQLADKLEAALRGTSIERIPMAANVQHFVRRYGLTPRQTTLVQLAVSGEPRRRYSEILGVTENTCKTMIRRLLHKCEVKTLAEIPRLILVEQGE